MNIDNCFDALKAQLVKSNDERIEGFDAVLRYMFLLSDDIVDEYKQDREFQKNSDSRFRFWTYVPHVERGASSVVIRWRRYTGRSRHSDPVPTSRLKEHRIPMLHFSGCAKSERRAIMRAEERFSEIRRLNEKILLISKAFNALLDLTGARETVDSSGRNFQPPTE